jgi:CheY-like chemotaxis protein
VSTILVVDDAPIDRELMVRVVTATGHRALLADDGARAIALARKHLPQLIFLDVSLPGMDGFAACRQLAADPQTRGIPVVLVMPRAMASAGLHDPASSGACDRVDKPWDSRRVEDLIRRYCT